MPPSSSIPTLSTDCSAASTRSRSRSARATRSKPTKLLDAQTTGRSRQSSEMPGPETTVDWDAGSYDRVGDPQLEWAHDVLGRLELAGDERVLDAGCGTGRVTRLLLDRLPRGQVVGVDASPS